VGVYNPPERQFNTQSSALNYFTCHGTERKVNSANPPLRCAAQHTPHSRLAVAHPPEWAEQVLQNETDSRSLTATYSKTSYFVYLFN